VGNRGIPIPELRIAGKVSIQTWHPVARSIAEAARSDRLSTQPPSRRAPAGPAPISAFAASATSGSGAMVAARVAGCRVGSASSVHAASCLAMTVTTPDGGSIEAVTASRIAATRCSGSSAVITSLLTERASESMSEVRGASADKCHEA
jgi:hypothetical protein